MILLKKEDYYTQRNNPTVYGDNPDVEGNRDYILKASSQCMPTSYVMFLKANKIPYQNHSGLPDDAYFAQTLVTEKAWEFAKSKYPNLIEAGIPPNEIHGMFGSYLSPIVCGRRVSDFSTDLNWDFFANQVRSGKAVMTSGKFPEAHIDGHAFVFIGYDETTQELIVADPWGNPHLNYIGTEGAKGYGIRYNKKFFQDHVKPGLTKWAHILI